jgi:hypothetical protein
MTTPLLVELERARALGLNPAACSLWTRAPWGLRLQYADGHIDDETFWNALERWLRGMARDPR